MDTKFSVAVHVLILISEASTPLNSDQMAGSVGTNASYVRKILALLKKSGVVNSHRGARGYTLTTTPEQITLLRIYQAVMEKTQIHLLDVHQNANDQCVVGRHIGPVLNGMFEGMEDAFARMLSERTLADCIAAIRAEMDHNVQSDERKCEKIMNQI